MRNNRAVVVSTNYDDKYLFFLPIIWYAWQKIGWDVICLMPNKNNRKRELIISEILKQGGFGNIGFIPISFNCSDENEVLYTQCSRLYAGNLEQPKYDILMVSDVDMMPLSDYWEPDEDDITVYGKDLSDVHFPMCYIAMSPENWRTVKSLTGDITMDIDIDLDYFTSICSDKWLIDQEIITSDLMGHDEDIVYVDRGKSPYSDYPVGRIDRSAWFASHKEIKRIDCHLPRPGFSDENWPLILQEIKENLNPSEADVQWLDEYRELYLKML